MSEVITTTHRDVEIVYMETPNRWRFIANGRERTVESLTKAREAIDRALNEVTTKKAKPWEPFEAYFGKSYYDTPEFEKVKVTSVAEGRGYDSRPQVWISHDGKRSKEGVSNLYKVCPENAELIAELLRLEGERQDVLEKMREARGKMLPVELPSENGDN